MADVIRHLGRQAVVEHSWTSWLFGTSAWVHPTRQWNAESAGKELTSLIIQVVTVFLYIDTWVYLVFDLALVQQIWKAMAEAQSLERWPQQSTIENFRHVFFLRDGRGGGGRKWVSVWRKGFLYYFCCLRGDVNAVAYLLYMVSVWFYGRCSMSSYIIF